MRTTSLILILTFLLSSCAPTATPSAPAPANPPATPTAPIFTHTPDTPHLTPDTSHLTPDTPHLTPDTPHLTPDTPHLTPDTPPDILTRAQKERLHQASLAYLSSTQEQAFAVVEKLNYVQYAHPSNMCGPLAIAELRDAGLLSRYTDLRDFWLLRPDANAETIARTFPADRFEHFRFTQSICDFDFKKFPLKAGDFLYLYAGDNGTFEHILTVTRVDEQGRAYTVTNLNTQPFPDYYYVIKELPGRTNAFSKIKNTLVLLQRSTIAPTALTLLRFQATTPPTLPLPALILLLTAALALLRRNKKAPR